MAMNKTVNVEAVRSDGLRFNYNKGDWGMLKLEGIDFPEIEIFAEPRGFGNGDIITGRRKHGKIIELTARVRMINESLRQEVVGFHNANYEYDLYITYNGITRIAKDCFLKAASYPSINVHKKPNLTLLYQSPHADLFADNADITSFVSTLPMWHDTRIYMPNGRLAFGEIKNVNEKIINYLGSEPASLVVTVKATGYVPGIDIAIDDKKTSIKTTLSSGDTLIIDCGERLVTKNGIPVPVADYDAWELMEMLLNYGDNLVKVSKNSNTAFTAEISFVGRYGGL